MSTDPTNITTQGPSITLPEDTNSTQPYADESSLGDYVIYGLSTFPAFFILVCSIGRLCVLRMTNKPRGNNSGTAGGGVVPPNSLASGVAGSGLTPLATFASTGLSPPDSSSVQFGSMTYNSTNFSCSYAQYSSDFNYSNFVKI